MKIGILGAGNIGGTLGKKWANAGHEIMFGVRDVSRPKVQHLLEETTGKATAASVTEAAAFGEVVLLAIPWSAVELTAKEQAENLRGKIVIDTTNNFGGPVVNNVAALVDHVPGAKVFRAFNSLGWENFAEPQFGELRADLFYCGPDDETRPTVEGLIADIGLRPLRVGGLDQVQLVDAVGSLWINLVFRQGMSRRLAFKLLVD